MKTIASLEQISQMVKDQHAQGVTLYVRTSTGPANDRRMGCSLNHAAGTHENGLSVTTLAPHPEIIEAGDAATVAQQINSWSYVAPITYILSGDVVGYGADGEPLLNPATWTAIALVDAQAIKAEHAATCRHTRRDRTYCYDCGQALA